MNYNSLKATINANIKQNGNQEITGVVLNSVLNAMVNALASAGATFGGVIGPTFPAPVSLDQATIYLALTPGEYTNFVDEESEPIVVDGIALIQYDGGGTLEFSKIELKPWQKTIVPDAGNDYIGIFVPNGGCTLAVDSIGFHGMICVTNFYDIAFATFVGGGGIDTSVNVQSGRESTTPVVVLKSNNDTPITITCVAGNAPDSAFGTDEIIITPIANKAWTELGAGGGSDVFVAEYGVTPYADVVAADTAGKAIFVKDSNNRWYTRTEYGAYTYVFGNMNYNGSFRVIKVESGGWGLIAGYNLEDKSNRVSTISGNETNTIKYPNTKAVADALGKWGVISQVQTWTTEPALNTPAVYQMSNRILGIIPQTFIDLAESIGATFNPDGYQAGVGYFELNGLTDLSYEEMIEVYNLKGIIDYMAYNGGSPLRALKKCPRTLPPISNRANTQYSLNYAFRVAPNLAEKTYIEAIGIGTESTDLLVSSGFSEMLYNAQYLRYFGVNGALKPNSSAASFNLAFQNCNSLTSVRIYGLCQNIDFAGTYFKPAIDLASIVFMVENAANTAAITIKVSPTTYGYCQADTTEYTYQGNTYTGILALATAKNITIASA